MTVPSGSNAASFTRTVQPGGPQDTGSMTAPPTVSDPRFRAQPDTLSTGGGTMAIPESSMGNLRRPAP